MILESDAATRPVPERQAYKSRGASVSSIQFNDLTSKQQKEPSPSFVRFSEAAEEEPQGADSSSTDVSDKPEVPEGDVLKTRRKSKRLIATPKGRVTRRLTEQTSLEEGGLGFALASSEDLPGQAGDEEEETSAGETKDEGPQTGNSGSSRINDLLKAGLLRDAAFKTSRGIFLSSWNQCGYMFATPEALDINGNYRALGYMRPLGIWGMQWAIEQRGLAAEAATTASTAEDT